MGAKRYIAAGLGWDESSAFPLQTDGPWLVSVDPPRSIASLAQSCSLPALNAL